MAWIFQVATGEVRMGGKTAADRPALHLGFKGERSEAGALPALRFQEGNGAGEYSARREPRA